VSSVYIEHKRKKDLFEATQNGRVIGRGDTQEEVIDQARRNRQKAEDPMLAERQRLRDGKPHPDKLSWSARLALASPGHPPMRPFIDFAGFSHVRFASNDRGNMIGQI
jgi:hypothetical protein